MLNGVLRGCSFYKCKTPQKEFSLTFRDFTE